MLHAHHLSPAPGTVGQVVADIPSGLHLTSPEELTRLIGRENAMNVSEGLWNSYSIHIEETEVGCIW
jgi:hypothetical protein